MYEAWEIPGIIGICVGVCGKGRALAIDENSSNEPEMTQPPPIEGFLALLAWVYQVSLDGGSVAPVRLNSPSPTDRSQIKEHCGNTTGASPSLNGRRQVLGLEVPVTCASSMFKVRSSCHRI